VSGVMEMKFGKMEELRAEGDDEKVVWIFTLP